VRIWLGIGASLAVTASAAAQTHVATLASDGAWTWYNDPRAVYHNGLLYFGYVRGTDGRAVLSAFDPATGGHTELWTSVLTQGDDHDNPGLLVKQDGRMLAIYARHNSDQFFSYRYSFSTSPGAPSDWSAEQRIAATGQGVTYANPYQLSAEGGLIYDFMRNQNYNPTVVTSADGGTNWSAPQLLIQTGTGSTRPYVKYCSNYTNRIDFLYTDGHPRNQDNSLYHAYYQGGGLYKTDGSLLKSFGALPLLHDSGERGSVIYQHSNADTADPNDHIPAGRAWCWETAYQSNGQPVAVFTVQRDQVTGANWYDDRIYYYYARWTGTNWQKRFIAHAGRPLYEAEDDYAGGICLDPEDANVVFLSSNAADPFNLSDTTNVALRVNQRYEIWKGVTTNGGLNFAWQTVTTNSSADNLRPYVPRHRSVVVPTLLWCRGNYSSYTDYDCSLVGLFPNPVQQPPTIQILSPSTGMVILTNLGTRLCLEAAAQDDGQPGPVSVSWTTLSGPANALFSNPGSTSTTAAFPVAGYYVLRVTASDTAASSFADVAVSAGPVGSLADSALWLRLDESAGGTASDASGYGNHGALSSGASWSPAGGMLAGALRCDGLSGEVVVPDADSLDNCAAFTLAFWMRADVWPSDSGGLVSKRTGISDNNTYTTWLKSDKRIYVDIVGNNNRFASSTVNTGAWYHVAVVFDGSLPTSSRARVYLNGALDVVAAENSSALPNYSSSVRLGNTHPGAANWFAGRFDDVRFYRRALDAGQVAALGVDNLPPNVWAGAAPAATNGVAASLSGGAADDGRGGPLTAAWSVIASPGSASFANSASPSTTVTFSGAGRYTLRLAASDSRISTCDELNVSVAPNPNIFEDWIALAFPGETNSAILSAAADPDGDGVKNFVEFALGMSATVQDAVRFAPGAPGLPIGVIVGIEGTNYLVLLVQRPVGRLGIAYSAEASGNLWDWTEAVQAGPPSPNGDGTETVAFRDILPCAQSSARFMRLKVTKVNPSQVPLTTQPPFQPRAILPEPMFEASGIRNG
jgi:hypothetical protein